MNITLICFGDELLKGSHLNTNVQTIALSLKQSGHFLESCLELPDSAEDSVQEMMRFLLARGGFFITTGGLGPTSDDQTRSLFAKLYQTPLVLDPVYSKQVTDRFGLDYPADEVSHIPEGAYLLPNSVGTACGFFLDHLSPFPNAQVLVLPGPPDEVEKMLESAHAFLPSFGRKKEVQNFLFFGVWEHEIYPAIQKLEKEFPAVSLGIYPSYGYVELSLTSEKKEALDSFAQKIHELFPHAVCLGESSCSLAELVVRTLIERKYTISSAESCTGGLFASFLTSVPKASLTFIGGSIVYSNERKEKEFHIQKEFMEQHGVVSEEIAQILARACQKEFDTTFSVAIVGYLGPSGGTDRAPCGTVHISIAFDRFLFHKKVFVNGSRKECQKKAALFALSFLAEKLLIQ